LSFGGRSLQGVGQPFAGLHAQCLQGFGPGDQIALAGVQSVACRAPGLLGLVEAEADLFEGLDATNELII